MSFQTEEYLTPDNFIRVKEFILKYGDRQTFCNMFNNNPHYAFDTLEVYLNPEPGGPYNHLQWNINCEPGRSDFNQIVIYSPENKYCSILYDKTEQVVRFSDRFSDIADQQEKGYKYFKQIVEYIKTINDSNEYNP